MAKRKINENVPNYNQLMLPTLKALMELGGSGTIEEINEKACEIEKFSDDVLNVTHDENGLTSEVDYRLAWARTYLKKYGLIENSSRGVWSLIDSDIDINKFDGETVVKTVREQCRVSKTVERKDEKSSQEGNIDNCNDWKEELLNTLLNISPDAFEKLTQRLLRESGFSQVDVTGKSGDGGIDGKGIVKINGFLSFHIIFQCKRYKGSITPSQIRDFRGAMQGRADKGLFITTGTFTKDATKEATRDGVPPIDLIDGDLLCEKIKEFSLGVQTETIESVEIKTEWFNKL
ncbi:restriction endonuclease [Achromatium sp. WMS3]|nr:restriction endonuclease [Achromatium sp. WMS3]